MRRAAVVLGFTVVAAAQAPSGVRDDDPARAFFARPGVIAVRITLAPEARQQLRQRPRDYVHAALQLDGATEGLADAGVKLKGAAGSFQEIDERPAFTVNLGKFGGAGRLFGLRRFHLNNCVQDDSRMCEWLGSEVFAAAGYPAPRVAHAHVWLDGEDLGFYVLREGYDAQFLRRAFGDAHGNLYDGGFCKDVDADLEKDAGDGPDDRSDLARLAEVCRAFDPAHPEPLAQLLDVDAFVDFMALEALVGHWDGYCQNQNNFRLWVGTAPGGAKFLPHGMDQIFDDSGRTVLDHPSALVASAVARRPEWRKQYRRRLVELLPLLSPKKLGPRLAARAAPLVAELRRQDRARADELQRAVDERIRRVASRFEFLQRHVREPEPVPLAFRGTAPRALDTWNAAGETDGIALKKRSYQGTTSLYFEIAGRGDDERRGAFRANVLLARGRYRLCATARCEGVTVPPGSGVRLCAGDASSDALVGDQRWTPLGCEFEVGEFQRSVELRLELSAGAGKAWFRFDSLCLVRVGDGG